MNKWMGCWISGWIDGLLDGWMNEWLDEWIVSLSPLSLLESLNRQNKVPGTTVKTIN